MKKENKKQMQALRKRGEQFWEYGKDVIYPPRCVVCDQITEKKERHMHFRCRGMLFEVTGPVCLHCGRPVSNESIEYCFDCSRQKVSSFRQGKALYLYRGQMKQTMYRFKYANKREYAQFFAKKAVDAYGDWIIKNKVEAIISVPMYPKKKKRRGYNQAEVFAKALAKQLEGSVAYEKNAVCRVKNTLPMKELNDIERKNNLKNAFQCHKNIVKYNRVLLVDDIYTTGSTAEAVSKELLSAGVKEIFVMSICIGKGV